MLQDLFLRMDGIVNFYGIYFRECKKLLGIWDLFSQKCPKFAKICLTKISTIKVSNWQYIKNTNCPHCFQYFFCYSIDATNTNCLAKFINDSPSSKANCKIVVVHLAGTPHLCIFAKRDINMYEELRYDYGCAQLEWRKVSSHFKAWYPLWT